MSFEIVRRRKTSTTTIRTGNGSRRWKSWSRTRKAVRRWTTRAREPHRTIGKPKILFVFKNACIECMCIVYVYYKDRAPGMEAFGERNVKVFRLIETYCLEQRRLIGNGRS